MAIQSCFQMCVYSRLHHQSQVLKVIQFTFSFQCYIFEKYFCTCLIFTLFISLGAFSIVIDHSLYDALPWKGPHMAEVWMLCSLLISLRLCFFFVSFIPIYIYLCFSKERSPENTLVKYSSRGHCYWLFVGTYNCDGVNHRHYMYLVHVAVLFTTDFGSQRSTLTRFQIL